MSWDALLEAPQVGGLRGKVLVVKHALPREVARKVVGAGAEAVIMPVSAATIGIAVRECLLSLLYSALASGSSPALAVAEANAQMRQNLLACVL